MKRNIIAIDEELCNGCGACVEGCHEGALQMIDHKARIVSELYCDGLGACIGECPVGAIAIEEREAEPYDETAVMRRISPKGEKTLLAHLRHLKEHHETVYLAEGIEYIKANGLKVDLTSLEEEGKPPMACGCPGSMARSFAAAPSAMRFVPSQAAVRSELTHWPVQLHLLNPDAGYLVRSDLILAADCTAFAYPDFHQRFLKGKKLAIACPKLDSHKEVYVEKLIRMIDFSNINTLTVVVMEVPCCSGLVQMARMALQQVSRKIPVKQIVVGVEGEIVSENWI